MENIYLYDETGGVEGPYTEREVMDISRRKDRMTATHFCSGLHPDWLPMAHFLFVLEPPEPPASKKEVGVQKVSVLTARDGRDCPACAALDGRVFPIDEPPTLPPPDCTCHPWCRSLLIAKF